MREETRNQAKDRDEALYYRIMRSHLLRAWLSAVMRTGVGLMLARTVVFGEYAPFGAAYLAAMAGLPGALPGVLGVLGGYATLIPGGRGAKYMAECALILLLSALVKWIVRPENSLYPVIPAAAASLLVGIAQIWEEGGGEIEWILFAAEWILTSLCAWIFRTALEKKQGESDLREASRFILAALALSSLGQFLIFGVSVGRSLCVILILLKIKETESARTGAAAGLMAGLASDMTFGYTPFFSLTMAFAGVIAGVLSRFGKLICGLAFLTAGAALTVWGHAVGGERYTLASLLEYAVGTFGFLAIPTGAAETGKKLDLLSGRNAAIPVRRQDMHTDWLRDFTYDRLYRAADAYLSVSEQTAAMKKEFSEDLIIPCIRESACTACPKRSECAADGHAEKEFVLLRKTLEETGKIQKEQLSEEFGAFCPEGERFAYEISKVWYASRCQMNYNARINEGLELLAKQYEGMANLLGRESQALRDDCIFDYRVEAETETMLREYGITAEVIAVNDARGRLRLEFYGEDLEELDRMKEHFEKELAEITGKNMEIGEKRRSHRGDYTSAAEKSVYTYAIGAASRRKKGNSRNGDYGSWFLLEDRLYILLSDGMGTGEQARRESVRFGGMIEKQIRGGAAPEDAITTAIHSRMLSDGMVCATADLVEIDLFNGASCFYKSGAAPSYIKGDGIRKITGGGLFGEKVAVSREILADQDTVIMVTDGVEDGADDAGLVKMLENSDQEDVQKLSEAVVARRRRGEREEDDRSVVMVRLYKRSL